MYVFINYSFRVQCTCEYWFEFVNLTDISETPCVLMMQYRAGVTVVTQQQLQQQPMQPVVMAAPPAGYPAAYPRTYSLGLVMI